MVRQSFLQVVSSYVALIILVTLGTSAEQDLKGRLMSEPPKAWRAYLDSLPDNFVSIAVTERQTPSV